jgi:hypothetical protein
MMKTTTAHLQKTANIVLQELSTQVVVVLLLQVANEKSLFE